MSFSTNLIVLAVLLYFLTQLHFRNYLQLQVSHPALVCCAVDRHNDRDNALYGFQTLGPDIRNPFLTHSQQCTADGLGRTSKLFRLPLCSQSVSIL